MPSSKLLLVVSCVGSVAVLGCVSDGTSSALSRPNDSARFSYGVGFDLGRKVSEGLAEDDMVADMALVRRGFDDGLLGRTPAIPEAEMDAVLRAVHQQLSERAARRQYDENPEFRSLADRNAANSEAAMRAFAARPGARKIEDGIWVIPEADGSGPVVGEDSVAIATLTVRTADGDEVNRAANSRLDPRSMLPAPGQVLSKMRAGDRWSIAFAPSRAFGLAGDPPQVGPNEAVFVDIAVIAVEPRRGSR
ncbi:MAG: FKBP-type peptidyl-prolyl cis-trans isomerase N-terminal domain-containing protein [Phycisphaeraceae bacterium]|nr:FKBP-type peptidyl-prolyl cis-trans isomerase N-terminal domain-containing protein [Phycisphaeraceae bacterium]